MLSSWSSVDGGRGLETTFTSKIWSVFWLPLAVKIFSPVELAVLASTLGGISTCAASGLFPWVVAENCRGSDFLPTTPCPACDGPSRKSKLLAFERLAFAWGPPLDPPLPRISPDRLRDTVGGCAFSPASWLLPCWLRPSHWEIFSRMLMPCSREGGLPDWRPCQATVAPFCRRSTSPPPRLPCSSLRASMLRGGKCRLALSSPLVNASGISSQWRTAKTTQSVVY